MLEDNYNNGYNQPKFRKNSKMGEQKMNKVKSLLFMACAALCLLAGCAQQQRLEPVEQICVPDTGGVEPMQIAENVLGQMHFTIEKADADIGFVRTRPLPGAQFFEFWRSDNVGSFNAAEANLHSIRRTVELNISRVISQDGEQLCIGCNVKVSRLSLPQRQITSSSQAYGMFSQSCPSIQKLKLHPEQKSGMAWIDSGKDVRLATEILKRIEKQIAKLQKEKTL